MSQKNLIAVVVVFCVLVPFTIAAAEKICNEWSICDGTEGDQFNPGRLASTLILSPNNPQKKIEIYISEDNMFTKNMGMAVYKLNTGTYEEDVWMERSFDGGVSWSGGIGFSRRGDGGPFIATKLFHVDDPTTKRIGALRACVKSRSSAIATTFQGIGCTEWVRTNALDSMPVQAAATALVQLWDADTGRWKLNVNWYNSAHALMALIDYSVTTGDKQFDYVIDQTFEVNKGKGFMERGYWQEPMAWGVLWLEAHRYTGEAKYLEMAIQLADTAWASINNDCGFGITIHKEIMTKNSIANILLTRLTAGIYNVNKDMAQLSRAQNLWGWYEKTELYGKYGESNQFRVVNGRLDNNCQLVIGESHSGDQGAGIGALIELYTATQDQTYLEEGRQIAESVLQVGGKWIRNGVLVEYSCELTTKDTCWDGMSHFKGMFVRDLGKIDQLLTDRPYKNFITLQKNTILTSDTKNLLNQYDLVWTGPFKFTDAGRQASALHVFNAAANI